MSFLQTFLMLFPACALFVAVAYVTELAWREEKRAVSAKVRRRMIYQEDGKPLCYEDDER
jgi:hypothetical protein